ncbi:MAG: glycosyltransferase [Nitrosomonas sp.]|nr:glycosyltransferase [Nitrosomonas sp.]
MDVALFVPSLRGGGAERAMVTLANSFAARGLTVDLLLASKNGPYLENVVSTVRVVDLQAGRVIKALLPLMRYLRREQPVAMLSAMGHANVTAILARMLAQVKTRVVVSERGLISGEHAIAQGLAARLNFILIPWLYPKADAICAVSQAASADLATFINLPRQRVQTLYNPFDLPLIKMRAAEPVEHSWFSPGQPPVLLSIGRLNEAKDFHILISAFARLRRKRAVRLMILGEGELRAYLQSVVSDCGLTGDDVQMPGFVNNPFIYLVRCSLFVLSSRREGLPGVLIEAMACGAPVVSTDCLSGPDEILEGGKWGKLVPVGDADALAAAMAAVLDTPRGQLPDVRQRARDFGLDRAVDTYLNILELNG